MYRFWSHFLPGSGGGGGGGAGAGAVDSPAEDGFDGDVLEFFVAAEADARTRKTIKVQVYGIPISIKFFASHSKTCPQNNGQ